MAERNTTINGKQIKAAVAADGLKKDASENLAIDVSDFAGTGLESSGGDLRIAATAAGNGLVGGGASALAVGAGDGIDVDVDSIAVDVTDIIDTAYGLIEDTDNDIRINLKANDGLKFGTHTDAGKLMIAYDNTTIGIIDNKLAVKDGAITEAKLAMDNDPTNGYYIKYVDDHMEWASIADVGFAKSDIIANEIPTGAIGGNTDFVLDYTPASGSLQVYLNGLLQEPGSGKDYMLSVATITFAAAPDVGDVVIANYVKA